MVRLSKTVESYKLILDRCVTHNIAGLLISIVSYLDSEANHPVHLPKSFCFENFICAVLKNARKSTHNESL